MIYWRKEECEKYKNSMTEITKKDEWCEIKKEKQKTMQRKKIKNGKKKEGGV